MVAFTEQIQSWFAAEPCRTNLFSGFLLRSGYQAPVLVFEIPDARVDPRFAENPLVIGSPGIVFYADVPLLTASGFPKGALCIMDVIPRKMSEDQISKLRNLGKMADKNLRLHGAIYHMNYRSKGLEASVI